MNIFIECLERVLKDWGGDRFVIIYLIVFFFIGMFILVIDYCLFEVLNLFLNVKYYFVLFFGCYGGVIGFCIVCEIVEVDFKYWVLIVCIEFSFV